MTETLSLDQAPIQRYFDWLRRLLFEGDFGLVSVTQQPVWDELKLRVPLTLKLITAATVMSVVVGVSVGIVTALRQYSGSTTSSRSSRSSSSPCPSSWSPCPQVVGRHQLQRLAA